MLLIRLKTEDGQTIAGLFEKAGGKTVLLLHMMPSRKESWRGLAEKLNQAGFSTLAIDFRGHGESQGGPEGYLSFSDLEHQAKINDLRAAVKYCQSTGAPVEAIVGASIGANLAIFYVADHLEIRSTIALSAGLDYHGVGTLEPVGRLTADQRLFLVASTEDQLSGQTADEVARTLFQAAKRTERKIEILDSKAHGTDLFTADPTLEDRLVKWLQK